MKKTTLPILIGFCIFTSIVNAAEDWELRRDREGVQVYTRSVEGSPYKAVRASTLVENVTLSSLVALVGDAEACPNWADRCTESYVYERISETEYYVYIHNSMPFPAKDRDIVSLVKWTQDPTTYEVVMRSTATTGIVDEKQGRLRLEQANASWTFTPTPSGAIQVSNEVHVDPGSALPGWVINMLLVDTPFQTMQGYIVEVKKPKYQNAQLPFIQEPPEI